MRLPLTNLRAFDAAARRLSFTRAADDLHLTQSAISQQIRQLEDRLGLPLFRRRTRRLELTTEGVRLYQCVGRALHDIDETVAALTTEARQGTVAMSAGTGFAARWLIPRLGHLADACPQIDLRLHPSDRLIDLHDEPSIDIAVRFAQKPEGDVIVRRLGSDQVFVVCSPALLAGRGPVRRLEDMADFPVLANEVSETEPGAAGAWSNWLNALGRQDIRMGSTKLRCPRSDLLVEAALHAQGIALVWETMVQDELRDGRLVRLFDGAFETANSYFAACTRTAFRRPRVRAVMDWLTDQAEGYSSR